MDTGAIEAIGGVIVAIAGVTLGIVRGRGTPAPLELLREIRDALERDEAELVELRHDVITMSVQIAHLGTDDKPDGEA